MKRIVLESARRFAVQEVDVPEPGPGHVLVRMKKVGICGSDMHIYRDGHIGDIAVTEPHVLGHECMGVVEEVGEGVTKGLLGRRVAIEPAIPCGGCEWCRRGLTNLCPDLPFLGLPPTHGAFQEYLVHPAEFVEPLPDSVSDGAGVMLEPLAIALHAVRLAKVKPGESIAILGTGVLGTCILAVLGLFRGLRVVCVDVLPDRLSRAREMGAEETINAQGLDSAQVAEKIRSAVGDEGAGIVFECAGVHQTIWNMCEVAAPAGHVAVIGSSEDDREIFSSGTARRKGLTLRFVRRSLRTLRPCIEMVRRGLIPADSMVTHTFPASRIADGFDTVEHYRDGVLKALIDMELW